MRLVLFFALGVASVCGCNPVQRTIHTAVVDPTSGTVYAFEVADPRRGSDYTHVIICNVSLPYGCYQIDPQYLATPEQAAAIMRALRETRADVAFANRPVVPAMRSVPVTAPMRPPTDELGDEE